MSSLSDPQPNVGSSKRLSLKRRTTWTLVGQVSYIVTQFLILVVLARFATPEDVGRFGFATAILTPVFWLLELGLRTNKATDVANRHHFRDLLVLRLISNTFGYSVVVAVALLLMDDVQTLAIIVVFGAAKAIEKMSEICYGTFEQHGQMRSFATSMVVRGIGSLVVFATVLIALDSVTLAFAGQLAVWAAVFLLHDLRRASALAGKADGSVHWRDLWRAVQASWVLGLSQFMSGLLTSLPRFIIERFLGLEALGYFTAISYLLQASNMVMNAVGRSIVGHLAQLAHADNFIRFRTVVFKYMLLTIVASLPLLPIAYFFGNQILVMVFGPSFAGQQEVFFYIVVTAAVRALSILLLNGPVATRKFNVIFVIRVIDLTAIFVFSLLGVWIGDLAGLAVGLACAAALQLLLLAFLFQWITKGSQRVGAHE